MITGIFTGVTSTCHTYIPSMLQSDGLSVGFVSTVLSIAVLCEAPLVFFSSKFMDKISNKKLMYAAYIAVIIQLFIYGFNLWEPFKILITLLVKHPAGMLFTMIHLKVVNTIIDEDHQITALAFIQTVTNLSSVFFQNAAGILIDSNGYAFTFLVFLGVILLGFVLLIFYKIPNGNDSPIFS